MSGFDGGWVQRVVPLFMPGNRYHVDIPESELVEEDDAEAGEWTLDSSSFPLDGRTLQEVKGEARRIKLGAVFKSFEEFDRCVDSWGVLNHRAVQRYKTSKNVVIRNCRCRKSPKPSQARKREDEEGGDEGEHGEGGWEDIGSNGCNFGSSQIQGGKEKDCRNGLEPIAAAQGNNAQDRALILLENIPPRQTLSHQQQRDLEFENSIRQMTRNARARQPLGELQGNVAQGPLSSDQSNSKRRNALVKHTSAWLGGRRKAQPAEGGKKQRKKSTTGACGELARYNPVVEEDPDDLCSAGECPWYVRVMRKKTSGQITITTCHLTHNCPQQRHRWRGATSKSFWLGVTLAPRVVRSLKGPVRELTVGFQQDYKRTTSYHQMWRAKDRVRDAFLGGQTKSFHCIPGLIRRFKEVDPGCKAEWSSVDGCSTFERAFVCPSACRKALLYCQPMVSLDACHSKNRKFPTQLFLATVLDGNMEILILCYAVAPTENYENWRWFLECMDGAIQGIEGIGMLAMSDRCKGLIAAVKEIFPGKIHGMCANHLRANVKAKFGKAAESFFLATVYANTEEEFFHIIGHLERSTAKGKAAGEYIRKLDARLYARYAFPLPRFGHVTSNPCEASNSGLLHIREFAPFKLLVEMWYYTQAHFNSSRKKASEWKETLTAPAHERHQENLQTFGQWQVFDDCGGTAKVQTTTGSEEYLVTTSGTRPTCSCFELQEMCWPCEHIMAWDDMLGKSLSNRFHLCWRTDSWRDCYEGIVPSFICNNIRGSDLCWPPEVAKKKGRHRVVRIKSGSRVNRSMQSGEDVFTDPLGNLYLQYPIDDNADLIDAMPTPATATARQETREEPKRKRSGGANAGKTSCGICGKPGHNRRTCKAVVPQGTDPNLVGGSDEGAQEEIHLSFPAQSQATEFDSRFERNNEVAQTPPQQNHNEGADFADMEELLGLYRGAELLYEESEPEGSEEEEDEEAWLNVPFTSTQESFSVS